MRFAKLAQPALDQRSISQHPAVHGAVVDLEAWLEEHLLDVGVAERIAQIPRTAWTISAASWWRPLKSSLDRCFSFVAMAFRIIGPSEIGEGQNQRPDLTSRERQQICDRPVPAP